MNRLSKVKLKLEILLDIEELKKKYRKKTQGKKKKTERTSEVADTSNARQFLTLL